MIFMFKNILFTLLFLVLFQLNSNSEIINDIEVYGNERISKNTILMFSDISVGQDLKPIETNEILKNLYNSDFFEDVQILFENNVLKIKVLELPIIQNVSIEGVKSNKIRDKICH